MLTLTSMLITLVVAAIALTTLQDALLKAFGLPPVDPRGLVVRWRSRRDRHAQKCVRVTSLVRQS